jgi:flagellar motor switch protein FliN/FliY
MANDDPLMSQDEIERLFSQTKDPARAPSAGAASASSGGNDDQAADRSGRTVGDNGEPGSAGGSREQGNGTAAATVAAAPGRAPSVDGRLAGRGTQPAREPDIATEDIEYLLSQAEKALESVNSGRPGDVPAGVAAYRFQDLSPAVPSTEVATLDLIRDVELDLKIELGRTHMYLEDVLKLRKGSVVPLDKMAGDPVDIYVNGRLIARGEVLVLNDNFCVRVAELIVGANAMS